MTYTTLAVQVPMDGVCSIKLVLVPKHQCLQNTNLNHSATATRIGR